ncbi:(+)-eremophilene synthase [Paramyrothecium foliicola]|nr:(+)-eremophilene synthase [Paramyrothecium foliicola]
MATGCPKSPAQVPKRINVTIPNMFQSFVVLDPTYNPHYETVKVQSEAWIGRICDFPPKLQEKIEKCDFSFFCAVAAPYAPRSKFRTLCDWGNWVFPFDDMFDNGELKNAPGAAEKMMNDLMAPMRGEFVNQADRPPILHVHDTVVSALEKCQPGVKKRFAAAMASYCHGALTQVKDYFQGRLPTVEEMMIVRRESAGVPPLYHLVEYAHELQVPDEAFNDPHIKELECLGSDLVSISNDILSYRKEEREGVPHNIVAIHRLNGMTAQQAFDAAGHLLETCYQRWETVEGLLAKSAMGSETDVARYVAGIKCVVQANVSWSFKAQRYLGLEAERVRDTRIIDVLQKPTFPGTTPAAS